MMEFGKPDYLYFLLTIPVVVILFWWYRADWKRNLSRFGDNELVERLLNGVSFARRTIAMLCIVLSLLMLGIGAANPRAGTKAEKIKRQGADICIAFDVSKSMLAEDLKPSRLERAKQWSARLIDKLQGDRIGLIVFAGKAFLQMPITADYSAAKIFIQTLTTDMATAQGTAIGEAITLGQRAFDSASSATKSKALIIITDGEDHDSSLEEALQAATEQGVKIYTVGVGESKGAPIPIYDGNGIQRDFKRAKDNTIVLSKLNEPLLVQISTKGNGEYVRLAAGESALDTILESISSLEKTDFEERVFTEYDDYFPYFLAFGLLFLTIEALLPERKRREKI